MNRHSPIDQGFSMFTEYNKEHCFSNSENA